MSLERVHPDTGAIQTMARAGSFLILLPHIDLQGVKKVPLPVPVALADKLSAGTSGGELMHSPYWHAGYLKIWQNQTCN
jgi:hypothetical protein